MARPANIERITAIHDLIRRRPGRHLEWYARHLGMSNKTAQGFLASADRAGFLFWEDERGRLYPFSQG